MAILAHKLLTYILILIEFSINPFLPFSHLCVFLYHPFKQNKDLTRHVTMLFQFLTRAQLGDQDTQIYIFPIKLLLKIA